MIAGGFENTNLASSSFIGGGSYNTIGVNGQDAVVPGGYKNIAAGEDSFAAGQYAQALHSGSFVWADSSSSTPYASTGPNEFLVRAGGGLYFDGNVRIDGNALLLEPNPAPLPTTGWIMTMVGCLESTTTAAHFLPVIMAGRWVGLRPIRSALSWDSSGDVWVNNNLSTGSLTVRGEYLVVNGTDPRLCLHRR